MRPSGSILGILIALAFTGRPSGSVNLTAHIASDDRQRQSIVDIDGTEQDPLKPAHSANVIFFVATDCPISNSYAPEIQQICRDYRSRGVVCFLVYEDLDSGSATGQLNEEVRTHYREYRYADIPALIDRTREIAKQTEASVTPQAVVFDRELKLRYRGRIDNWYVAFGKRRPRATEHDLRDALDAVLEGRRVPKVETHPLGCYIADPASLRKK